ncbi:MAG TPA: hypothetical protein VHM26_04455 [Chitinophagaceae bacterium]|jgi:hypothetical protein|nr:hypothetical protein [Chitinophagaceae bacterium]
MNDALREKAQQYLKEIEATRRLPFKTGWAKEYKRYTSSIDYAKKYKPKDERPLVIDVRNNIGLFFLLPLWIFTPMLIIDKWKTNTPWIEFSKMMVIFVVSISVVILFQNVPGKWIWLRLTQHGLWLSEENTLVRWDDILWSGIETIPGDDTEEVNFVVNYYDERCNDFREYRINKQKLSIKNAELCFYIEYFRKESHEHRKQLN